VARIAPSSRLLILVGAGFFAAQLTLFSVHRAPSWDEAVYLSQVTPGARAVFFAPSRARGITLLVAPVTGLGGSIAAVRVFLAAASSVALVAAFLAWVRILGSAVPLAAFLFGFTWLALFYGSEVMPNLWAGLAGVAAVGVMGPAMVGEPGRWRVPVAAFLLLLVGLVRPPDAVPVAVALLAGLLATGRASVRTAGALGAGLVLGWCPWLVEMAVRFHGVSEAFGRGGSVAHVGIGAVAHRVFQHLALTDGPTLGPDDGVPPVGLLWWAGLVGLTAWALISGRRGRSFVPVLVAAVAGGAAVVEYVVFVGGLAPRFLLPAYAFLSVTAGAGIRSLVASAGLRRAAGAGALVLVAAWAGWQVLTADRVERGAVLDRAAVWRVGVSIHHLATGRPCSFASSDGYPQVQLASGCLGRSAGQDAVAAARELETSASGGEAPFLVQRAPGAALPPGWVAVARIAGPGGSWWVISTLEGSIIGS